MRIARRGLLLVLSSPSGAGKTTLSRRLLAADPNLRMSVSVTTRKPRRDEVDGKDYAFIDKAEFDRLQAASDLLEYAQVHGNCYGTPKAPVVAAIAAGEDMLFDIDWQGARQLKEKMGEDVVAVFILPPDGRALAVASSTNMATYGSPIYIVNADGDGLSAAPCIETSFDSV